MPRRKPLIRSRQRYSSDLKRRVVYQAYTLKMETKDIAKSLDMPQRVVQRVLKCWREIGDVCQDPGRAGRALLMSPKSVDVRYFSLHVCKLINLVMQLMLALIEHSPDIYLDEIQERLFEQHDLEVSLSTICRTLKRLGITSKKVSAVSTIKPQGIYVPSASCSYPVPRQSAVRRRGASSPSKLVRSLRNGSSSATRVRSMS